jgi:hypothetical protein
MKFESDSRGPGRVIDRRGQKLPASQRPRSLINPFGKDPSSFGKYTRAAGSGTASPHKLGLSNFSAVKSPNFKTGMPKSYKVPDRKSTRASVNQFNSRSR